MEARADAQAVERPVALEALADQAQDGHLALRPLDAPDALGGQAEVGHVVGRERAGGGHRGSVSLRVKRRRNGAARSGQGEPEAMDEAFLEADVLGEPEAAVGVEGRRVVRPDVEHDLVARAQQLGGHRAGHGRREPASTIVDVGQDVADDRQPRRRADDVGPGRGDQRAVDADAVVDALGDAPRRQPRREPELVEPVEIADVDRQDPLDGRRVRAEVRPVDPHPDHRRTRVHAVVAPRPRAGRRGRIAT